MINRSEFKAALDKISTMPLDEFEELLIKAGDNPTRLNKHNTPKCSECKTLMKRGQYIKETLKKCRGDFWDNGPAVTVSGFGVGELADCWKCEGCGESRL